MICSTSKVILIRKHFSETSKKNCENSTRSSHQPSYVVINDFIVLKCICFINKRGLESAEGNVVAVGKCWSRYLVKMCPTGKKNILSVVLVDKIHSYLIN